MLNYTLYKKPIDTETLAIVRFLHHSGYDTRPTYIIERNYPSWVTDLPSIYDGDYHIGMEACIQFFENKTHIENIKEKSAEFLLQNPKYRINK